METTTDFIPFGFTEFFTNFSYNRKKRDSNFSFKKPNLFYRGFTGS